MGEVVHSLVSMKSIDGFVYISSRCKEFETPVCFVAQRATRNTASKTRGVNLNLDSVWKYRNDPFN